MALELNKKRVLKKSVPRLTPKKLNENNSQNIKIRGIFCG